MKRFLSAEEQRQRYWKQAEECRKIVKWSVIKKVQGEGLRYDDYQRQDSFHDAIERTYRQIVEGKVTYIAGLKLIILNNKTYPVKAYLCMMTRSLYFNYLKKNEKQPIVELDKLPTTIDRDMRTIPDGYRIITGRLNSLDNSMFKLNLKLYYDETSYSIIEKLLAREYKQDIAKDLEIPRSTFYKYHLPNIKKHLKNAISE